MILHVEDALRLSIEHWRVNEQALTTYEVSTSPMECALCSMFFWTETDCIGCPVSKRTGLPICEGTPYYNANKALIEWGEAGDFLTIWRCREKFKLLARDMRRFLEGLSCKTSPAC